MERNCLVAVLCFAFASSFPFSNNQNCLATLAYTIYAPGLLEVPEPSQESEQGSKNKSTKITLAGQVRVPPPPLFPRAIYTTCVRNLFSQPRRCLSVWVCRLWLRNRPFETLY